MARGSAAFAAPRHMEVHTDRSSLTVPEVDILSHHRAVYRDTAFADAVWNVMGGADTVSLRMLDWVCTNYAKSRALRVRSLSGGPTYVFESYLAQLRYYRRRYFDPFRRVPRVQSNGRAHGGRECKITRSQDGATLPTTLAQLNFMCWAHASGLLQFVRDHRDEIEADMNAVNTSHKRRRADRAPRNPLSRRPFGRCQVYSAC